MLSPNVIGDLCKWPCSRVTRHKVKLHFAKMNRVSEPHKPLHSGLESVLIRSLKTTDDWDYAFAMEKRYQTTKIQLKDFLILEYKVRDGFTHNLIRDREWLGEISCTMDDFVLVPKSFADELRIIKAFKWRCKNQEISF